ASLFKSPTRDMAEVGTGRLSVRLITFFFLLHNPGQHLPIEVHHPLMVGTVGSNYFGVDIEEGEMGQDIINITPTPGHFHVHLVLIDPVAISFPFGRHNRCKSGMLIPLSADQPHITAFLYPPW